MTDPKLIGMQVARLRKARGQTQEALGDAVGFSRATIASIEAGFQAPGLKTASALADYFKIPLDYLLCRKVPKGGPLVGKFVENRDVLALIRFWESLPPADRDTVVRLLQIPVSEVDASAA